MELVEKELLKLTDIPVQIDEIQAKIDEKSNTIKSLTEVISEVAEAKRAEDLKKKIEAQNITSGPILVVLTQKRQPKSRCSPDRDTVEEVF